jgi:hypothetical protein
MTNNHNRSSNLGGSFAKAGVWLYIVAIGVFTFAAVELEKWLRFRTGPNLELALGIEGRLGLECLDLDLIRSPIKLCGMRGAVEQSDRRACQKQGAEEWDGWFQGLLIARKELCR